MEDLRFVHRLVEEFFSKRRVRSSLKVIKDKEYTDWEKWLQIELGSFLGDHPETSEYYKEKLFLTDKRKDKERDRVFVDLLFRRKNCTIGYFLGIELKQSNSFTSCLRKMLEDCNKIDKVKGSEIRECFMLGVHPKISEDEAIKETLERHGNLPSKKRVIAKSIGNTGFSYTLF